MTKWIYTLEFGCFLGTNKINFVNAVSASTVVIMGALAAFPFSESFQQDDSIPPTILTPANLTFDAKDKIGTKVSYEVSAFDETDNVVKASCFPESNSYFLIGENEVKCVAMDSAGNKAEKTFIITINSAEIEIPNKIKKAAWSWCNNETDDASLIDGIQQLIESNMIIVSKPPSTTGSQEIPSWVKNNACWWSSGAISNEDFTSGIEYLLKSGIIQL